jgi:CsoR family transcriptional regulator, copper-sensing transcriptional repressor
MTKKKNDCCEKTGHPDHAHLLPRLNRVAGQVAGVKKMVEEKRYCPDMITQLRAIRAALSAIEAGMLSAHLDACVMDAFASKNAAQKTAKIEELKTLYMRYGA